MSGFTYGTEVTMTVTNLHSLASSLTAGWQSDAIDLSAGGFVDVIFQIELDFANTAPGSTLAVWVFIATYGGTVWSKPATGTQGTITLTDISVNRQHLYELDRIPYVTTDETIKSREFYVSKVLPSLAPKISIILMNASGAALAASGNTVRYRTVSLA